MSELTFEQMLEESFKTIRNGEVVDGTVIDVKPDEIILKTDFFISLRCLGDVLRILRRFSRLEIK